MEQPMTTRRLMYEGDSLIHAARTRSTRPIQAQTARPTEGDRTRPSQKACASLAGVFPKLSVWLSNRIHFSRMREVESYLAQATDLVDLEHRIAQIERSARWH